MSLPIKVICINNGNKPIEIPINKWLEQGEVYTLIDVQHLLSSNSLGFILEEITLDDSCFPYYYFNPNRFEPINQSDLDSLDAELDEILYPKLA